MPSFNGFRGGVLTIVVSVAFAACTSAGPSPGSEPPSVPALPSPSPATPSPSIAAPTVEPTDDPPAVVEWHAIDCSGDGPCHVEYQPSPGPDLPGWPVLVTGPCRGITTTPEGVSYALCDAPDGVLVHAFDADGESLSGWPVALPGTAASVYANDLTIGCGQERSAVVLRPDGAVVVATVDGSTARLHVLTADRERVAGWPQPFPGDPAGHDGVGGNGCRGFLFLPDLAVLAWGYEGIEPAIELVAERTVFTVYEADGTLRSGWPRSTVGAASHPVVFQDGSIAYVSASAEVWRHLPGGEIAPGWPYELPGQMQPRLSPDGRLVFVITDDGGVDRVVALGPAGEVVRGWPVSLKSPVQSRCVFGDTPCIGRVDPVFGADGTLYVPLADGTITSIRPDGAVASGWPVRLGGNLRAIGLSITPDGHLLAEAVVCDHPTDRICADGRHWLEFSPAGKLVAST